MERHRSSRRGGGAATYVRPRVYAPRLRGDHLEKSGPKLCCIDWFIFCLSTSIPSFQDFSRLKKEKKPLSLSLISHLKRKNIHAFDTIFLPFLINRYFHKTAFESVRKVSVKKIQNGRFLQWRFRGGAGKLLSNRRDINTHV